MSAGTLTLTNNSAAVAGSGTAFTTEVAAGDFIVVTVGGVPYTLPIKSVESGTALTLVSNFTGPTQAGAGWSAVPRMALNMVTAALVAQSAEALRGLNYDKQNWQQVYSTAGSITVRLPDGTTFTGPSWKYLSDNMATKSGGTVPVNQGGTGAPDAEGARASLKSSFQDDQPIGGDESINGLRFFKPGFYFKQYDPAATIENGFPPGNRSGALHTLLNGANGSKGVTQLYYPYSGVGGVYIRQFDAAKDTFFDQGLLANGWKELLSSNGNIVASADAPVTASNRITDINNAKANHVGFCYNSAANSPGVSGTFMSFANSVYGGYGFQLLGSYDNPGSLYYRSRNGDASIWYPWVKLYGTNNTTTDTNGNLRPASPIVKLNGDGTAELNEEAEGVMAERIDTGIYKISGVLGFNSEPIWGGVDGGFVIPVNTNGLPLLWVDYEIDPDGSITLKTYHRIHHSAPKFARNLIGIKNEDGSFTETVQDGEPVDIPAGRWVDLRVEMPRNSLWNIKQQEVQEAMEIAERERQQNQHDTQSQN